MAVSALANSPPDELSEEEKKNTNKYMMRLKLTSAATAVALAFTDWDEIDEKKTKMLRNV